MSSDRPKGWAPRPPVSDSSKDEGRWVRYPADASPNVHPQSKQRWLCRTLSSISSPRAAPTEQPVVPPSKPPRMVPVTEPRAAPEGPAMRPIRPPSMPPIRAPFMAAEKPLGAPAIAPMVPPTLRVWLRVTTCVDLQCGQLTIMPSAPSGKRHGYCSASGPRVRRSGTLGRIRRGFREGSWSIS